MAGETPFAIVRVGDVNIDLSDLPLHTRKLCETLIVAGVWAVGPLRERWAAKARIATAAAESEVARIRRDDAIEAQLCEIKGKLEIADFEQRMAARTQQAAQRQYRNIESIALGAADFGESQVSDDEVDQDWLAQFFEYGRNVSDPQMQSIWSHILAREVATPGRFSLRTLHAVKMLRKTDAELFTRYCQFVWDAIESGPGFAVVPGEEDHLWAPERASLIRLSYHQAGISTLRRMELQNLGLIVLKDPNMPLNIRSHMGLPGVMSYRGQKYWVRASDNRVLRLPVDFLTDIGAELASIAGAPPNADYQRLVLEHISESGFVVSTSYPGRDVQSTTT
jgi:uncharacterized repeat protein (TIGR03899 family)